MWLPKKICDSIDLQRHVTSARRLEVKSFDSWLIYTPRLFSDPTSAFQSYRHFPSVASLCAKSLKPYVDTREFQCTFLQGF